MEVVKMSSKGQLVVPADIRSKLSLDEGDRFVAVDIAEGVLFKKIKLPTEEQVRKELNAIQQEFQKAGVSKKDVKEALAWARNELS